MAHFLILFGGILQMAGVVTVVVSLRGTLAKLAAYEQRAHVVYGAAAISLGAAFSAVGVTTPNPSLEDRVANLEARVAALPGETTEAIGTLRDEMRGEIARSRDVVTQTYRNDFEALANLTTRSLRDQRLPTYVGAGLLVVGLAFATVGSVIA
jgi:hypothetical protein